MKRLAVAALAALTFGGALAPAAADARDRHHRGWDRHDRDYDNRDDRRDERRAYRDGYRDGRHHNRWDDRRYNGYEYRGQWHYGPPPAHYSDYRPAYRHWRRGDRLPSYYRDRYIVVNDYHRYGLRHPPRGYHYVRDDRGEYLLVGIATGVILGAILSQ